MNPSKVLCLTGDDASCRIKKQWYITQYQSKYPDAPIEHLDVEELDVDGVASALQTQSLFDEKRMCILRGVPQSATDKLKARTVLEEILPTVIEHMSDDVFLLLYSPQADKRKSLFKKLKKASCVVSCEAPKGAVLQKELCAYAEGALDTTTARALVQQVGEDFEAGMHAVDKVRAYAGGKSITVDMINNVLEKSDTPNIFQLLDKLSERNAKHTLRELEILEQNGEDLFMIHAMLMRQVRLLYYFATTSNAKELSTVLKLHPFVEKKTRAQAQKLPKKVLQNAYQSLLNIDRGIKTGQIRYSADDRGELRTAIDTLIVDICQTR